MSELPYDLDLNYDIKTKRQLRERLKRIPTEIRNLEHELKELTEWSVKLGVKLPFKTRNCEACEQVATEVFHGHNYCLDCQKESEDLDDE